MVHRLPKASLVQRIPHVAEQVRGRSVDPRRVRRRRLPGDAGRGRDLAARPPGRDAPRTSSASTSTRPGWPGRRPRATRPTWPTAGTPTRSTRLGIQPAEIVVAGEVIEHLDDPGSFLDGLHRLLAPGGQLILTTPNASGLLNGFAAMAGAEINHPDHVILFSWRTLTNLMARHGWEVVDTATFVPAVKAAPGSGAAPAGPGPRRPLRPLAGAHHRPPLGPVRGRRPDRHGEVDEVAPRGRFGCHTPCVGWVQMFDHPHAPPRRSLRQFNEGLDPAAAEPAGGQGRDRVVGPDREAGRRGAGCGCFGALAA